MKLNLWQCNQIMDLQLPLELFAEDNVAIADNKKGHLKIQDGTWIRPTFEIF